MNYSEIVYSDNYGTAWTRSGVKWNADSNFTQVAYLKENGLIYVRHTFGTLRQRSIWRVSASKLLDKSAYEYWTQRRLGAQRTGGGASRIGERRLK
ncbi:MAG: DUF4185 domain-containing protein [Alistipes onderdonkii]